MAHSGFSRSDLAQAVDQARLSPYLADPRPPRPWLRLLGLIGLSAAFLLAAALLLGVALALASGLIGFDAGLLQDSVPEGPARLEGEKAFMAVLAISLGVMALSILLAALIVYRRPARSFLWPAGGFSLGKLWLGFAVMGLIAAISLPLYSLVDPSGPAPLLNDAYSVQSRIGYAAAAAVALLAAAAAEEVVFRGVLLRVLGGFTGRVIIICLINALLFSAIHLDPDPVAFVARALSGLVWTWAALRLGGIEFAIGAHWANNLAIALLIEPLSTAAMPGQAMPPAALLFEGVTVLLVFVFIERLARRGRLNPP